jgi:hypothetical protein
MMGGYDSTPGGSRACVLQGFVVTFVLGFFEQSYMVNTVYTNVPAKQGATLSQVEDILLGPEESSSL